ncbi:hypothetical protein SASPL_108298 [Salvia splendens]|uniref:Uncharacterized protein n=1 Tax=Salvia splendens TaxID=180675 RepID=A0A8X8YHW1_SALSN|nr:hypothetical protein SASPL_108298 [Salvia splendens]
MYFWKPTPPNSISAAKTTTAASASPTFVPPALPHHFFLLYFTTAYLTPLPSTGSSFGQPSACLLPLPVCILAVAAGDSSLLTVASHLFEHSSSRCRHQAELYAYFKFPVAAGDSSLLTVASHLFEHSSSHCRHQPEVRGYVLLEANTIQFNLRRQDDHRRFCLTDVPSTRPASSFLPALLHDRLPHAVAVHRQFFRPAVGLPSPPTSLHFSRCCRGFQPFDCCFSPVRALQQPMSSSAREAMYFWKPTPSNSISAAKTTTAASASPTFLPPALPHHFFQLYFTTACLTPSPSTGSSFGQPSACLLPLPVCILAVAAGDSSLLTVASHLFEHSSSRCRHQPELYAYFKFQAMYFWKPTPPNSISAAKTTTAASASPTFLPPALPHHFFLLYFTTAYLTPSPSTGSSFGQPSACLLPLPVCILAVAAGDSSLLTVASHLFEHSSSRCRHQPELYAYFKFQAMYFWKPTPPNSISAAKTITAASASPTFLPPALPHHFFLLYFTTAYLTPSPSTGSSFGQPSACLLPLPVCILAVAAGDSSLLTVASHLFEHSSSRCRHQPELYAYFKFQAMYFWKPTPPNSISAAKTITAASASPTFLPPALPHHFFLLYFTTAYLTPSPSTGSSFGQPSACLLPLPVCILAVAAGDSSLLTVASHLFEHSSSRCRHQAELYAYFKFRMFIFQVEH